MAGYSKTKLGRSGLNLGLATVFAGAVAFFTFAMPTDVFSDLVSQSGLPALLPAAEPPLGMTARYAAIGAAALLSFTLVWLLLRAFDRPASRPAVGEPSVVAPRLRRADAHPDAPSRRPIFAGLDLGEPIEPVEQSDDDFEPFLEPAPRHADLPAFLVPQPEQVDEWPAKEAAAEVDWIEESETAEPTGIETPSFEPSAVAAEEESIEAPEAYIEPVLAAPTASDPSAEFALAENDEEVHDVGNDELDAEDVLDLGADEEATIDDLAARLPEPEEENSEDISTMMARLETGITRRGRPRKKAQALDGLASHEPQEVDERLRSALNDIQKMVGRTS